MPWPVTRPIRALTTWMPTISGVVRNTLHSIARPNCAPACEYVAMPLGSSSAAPVIRPGPRRSRNLRVRWLMDAPTLNDADRGRRSIPARRRFPIDRGGLDLRVGVIQASHREGRAREALVLRLPGPTAM